MKKMNQDTSVVGVRAHSNDENQSAANLLRALLDPASGDGEAESELQNELPLDVAGAQEHSRKPEQQEEEDHERAGSIAQVQEPFILALPSSEWMANRMLKHAYEKEYDGPPGWRRGVREGGWRDQTELWEQTNNHILEDDALEEPTSMAQPHVVNTDIVEHSDVSVDDPVAYSTSPPFVVQQTSVSTGMVLPRMGSGLTRNNHGHHVLGGQAIGAGVIGAHRTQGINDLFKITQTEAGCDLPMRRLHHVTLDPSLPPLALEHPARVWNSTIHALPASKQPIIKWDYARQKDQYGGEAKR